MSIWYDTLDVADRYRLSPRTIAEWRSKGTGPKYADIGRSARYAEADVLDYEAARLAASPHPGAVGAH